jgi:hypothetical protein
VRRRARSRRLKAALQGGGCRRVAASCTCRIASHAVHIGMPNDESSLLSLASQCGRRAGIEAAEDSTRGFDHGVFVPLKLAFPDAEVGYLVYPKHMHMALWTGAGELFTPMQALDA